jgi:Sec-independent protein translocase protein TatA
MEILGIGPLELVLILIIALIVMGPKDMAKAGLTIGKFLRKVVSSPAWGTIRRTSKEIKYLPNRLMREAGLEESEIAEIQQGLSMPEMDRRILNPNFKPPAKKPEVNQMQPDQTAQVEKPADQFNAWTAAWDEPSPSASPAPPDNNHPPVDPG